MNAITLRNIRETDFDTFTQRIQERLNAGFKIIWINRSDGRHYPYEALLGYEVPPAPDAAATKGPDEMFELVTVEDCVELYNNGYMRGHNDTVESCFTDIYSQDMRSYHEEEVVEILKERH